ncbi:unnamed protein product [Ectocarpus sp. 4 AP-2014]
MVGGKRFWSTRRCRFVGDAFPLHRFASLDAVQGFLREREKLTMTFLSETAGGTPPEGSGGDGEGNANGSSRRCIYRQMVVS